MNRFIGFLTLLCATLLSFSAYAYTPPTPTGYVTDLAGKLSPDDKAKLEAKLTNLDKTSKNQIAALILPSLGDEAIDDIANDTFKAWKVGQKDLDNGVLVVIAVSEHKSRIETGKGVEGELTDLQCAEILRSKLAPQLRKGDFYQGLNDTFDAILTTLDSRKGAATTPKPTEHTNGDTLAGVLVLGVMGFLGFLWLVAFILGRRKQSSYSSSHDSDYFIPKTTYVPIISSPVIRTVKTPSSSSRKSHSSSSSSSYGSSSSSSSDYGSSSSWGGGSDSGGFGGFGGGDSGGGGASGDW